MIGYFFDSSVKVQRSSLDTMFESKIKNRTLLEARPASLLENRQGTRTEKGSFQACSFELLLLAGLAPLNIVTQRWFNQSANMI